MKLKSHVLCALFCASAALFTLNSCKKQTDDNHLTKNPRTEISALNDPSNTPIAQVRSNIAYNPYDIDMDKDGMITDQMLRESQQEGGQYVSFTADDNQKYTASIDDIIALHDFFNDKVSNNNPFHERSTLVLMKNTIPNTGIIPDTSIDENNMFYMNTGLLKIIDKEEIEAVWIHEEFHIGHKILAEMFEEEENADLHATDRGYGLKLMSALLKIEQEWQRQNIPDHGDHPPLSYRLQSITDHTAQIQFKKTL